MGSTMDTCPPLGHPTYAPPLNVQRIVPHMNGWETDSLIAVRCLGAQVQDRNCLEPVLGERPGQPLPSCVSLANLLHFSGPRFSHLYNERRNSTFGAMKMK